MIHTREICKFLGPTYCLALLYLLLYLCMLDESPWVDAEVLVSGGCLVTMYVPVSIPLLISINILYVRVLKISIIHTTEGERLLAWECS